MTPEETINKVTCDLFPGCIDEADYEPTKKSRDEINDAKKAVDINDPAAFMTADCNLPCLFLLHNDCF